MLLLREITRNGFSRMSGTCLVMKPSLTGPTMGKGQSPGLAEVRSRARASVPLQSTAGTETLQERYTFPVGRCSVSAHQDRIKSKEYMASPARETRIRREILPGSLSLHKGSAGIPKGPGKGEGLAGCGVHGHPGLWPHPPVSRSQVFLELHSPWSSKWPGRLRRPGNV